jgi:hypothetical protein
VQRSAVNSPQEFGVLFPRFGDNDLGFSLADNRIDCGVEPLDLL